MQSPGHLTRMRDALGDVLADTAAGRFPPADGTTLVLPQPSERDAGVISLTGHTLIFADLDPGWIAGQLPSGDLSAPLSAAFLSALGSRLGRQSHGIDLLACAAPLPGPPPAELGLADLAAEPADATAGPADRTGAGPVHPRIARALRYRDDVRAWQVPGGVLMLGRGVAGRWEAAIEVDPAHRGHGLGAALATAARHLVPDGVPLWAQIAPANAASVRAFLRAGYRPVGAEALLTAGLPA